MRSPYWPSAPRLPPGLSPERATAQTVPSRLTTLAHISLPSPPLSPMPAPSARTVRRAFCSVAWFGNPAQAARSPLSSSSSACADCMLSTPMRTALIAKERADCSRCFIMLLPLDSLLVLFLTRRFTMRRGDLSCGRARMSNRRTLTAMSNSLLGSDYANAAGTCYDTSRRFIIRTVSSTEYRRHKRILPG